MLLSGYGVELAIKSTEYKAVDDTKVKGQCGDLSNVCCTSPSPWQLNTNLFLYRFKDSFKHRRWGQRSPRILFWNIKVSSKIMIILRPLTFFATAVAHPDLCEIWFRDKKKSLRYIYILLLAFLFFEGNLILTWRSNSLSCANIFWRAPMTWLLLKCGKCKV